MNRLHALTLLLVANAVLCPAMPFERQLNLPNEYHARRVTKLFPVKPGETRTLLDLPGPACISHIWMTTNRGNDFRRITLRMYWDGEAEPSVESPLADFFGVGHNRSGLDESFVNPCLVLNPFNGYNSYFPMPFGKHAKITITNEQDIDIKGWVYFQADYLEYNALPREAPYFHAQWRRESPALRRGRPYTVMQAAGKGFLAGMTYHIRVDDTADDWCHGGGDFVFLDAQTRPYCIKGIGGEDYFGASWGINPFVSPYSGCTRDVGDKQLSMYRFYLESPIPFEHSVRLAFGAMANEVTSVGYWYQAEPHHRFFNIPPSDLRMPWSELEPGTHDLEMLPEQQLNAAVIGPFKGDIDTTLAVERQIEFERPVSTNYERAYKTDHPGKDDDRMVRWERARTTLGWLDFEPLYRPKMKGPRGVQTITGAIAYACLRVQSDRARSCPVLLGSDDPVRIWVNQKQVADRPEQSGFSGQTIMLPLRKGDNEILLKVTNGFNQNWSVFAVSFDFPDRDGLQFDEFAQLPASQEYARPPRIAGPDAAAPFNDVVLKAVAQMPHGGGYSTTTLAFTRLCEAVTSSGPALKVDTQGTSPTFCSGATYLVFTSALSGLQEVGRIQIPQSALTALGVHGQEDGEGVWGRWNANGPGTARLFHELGLGTNFMSFDDAEPGDFMKIFWNDEIGRRERGHSVVYLGRSRDSVATETVRFWSSGAPEGFGEVTIPRSRIKRVIFSRLEHPERIANAAKLPLLDTYLAEMLKRPGSEDEMCSMTGVLLLPAQAH